MESQSPRIPDRIAILPLRNAVLFPQSVAPVSVVRARSIQLVEELEGKDTLIGVVAQRDDSILEPTFEDLYTFGTLAQVVKVIRINAESYSVVLRGVSRFHIEEALSLEPYMRAEVRRVESFIENIEEASKVEIKSEEVREKTRKVLSLLPDLPQETSQLLDNVDDPGELADLIASNFPEELASVQVRQRVLEALNDLTRLTIVERMLERQLEGLETQAKISNLVETEMTQNQRAYVLRQQLKAIREELGESSDEDEEVEQLRERLAILELPDEVRKVARKQLSRIAQMPPQASEYQVARSYIEWILDLPWNESSQDNLQVETVKSCLDEDHFGLDDAKKRIIEFAAVRKLRKDNRSPILLFLGPPGVGKTSMGKSIARAMGRRYARIALGGVRDEAEIRGHRRTYVGALPGRILQALKKAGTNNPVLVLDEIDKMGSDMRGDPGAALLEVLDPKQNDTFVDHYLDLPFDLSKVTFLATANYWGGVPEALRDRLEIIEVPGYTPREKSQIALKYLVPKQISENGLNQDQVEFTPEGIDFIVEGYTREAGVRGLEKQVAGVCRDMAVRLAEGKTLDHVQITPPLVEELKGPAKFQPELAELVLTPGVGVGLGASGAGGELLLVEVRQMPGKGAIRVTGSLGPVLKEAANTAVSFVRSKSEELQLDPEWIKKIDLHLHIPRAQAVFDFAGCGLTIFAAVCSLLLDNPCRGDVAVIGELTLRGSVLPVRNLRAMLFAAQRAGVKEVIVPSKNRPDVEETPKEVTADLSIRYIDRVDQVLALVLQPPLLENDQILSAASRPPARA